METTRLVIFGLIATTFLAGCRPHPRAGPASSTPSFKEQSELKMTSMFVQSYDIPGLEWELKAPYGEVFTRKNVTRVKSLHVQLFDQGQKSTEISADQGIMSTGPKPVNSNGSVDNTPVLGVSLDEGDMYLSGNVVMISTDGTKMTTDWAYYTRKTELITSSAPVRVERHGLITTGVGMEATSDMSSVHIFNETLIIPERPEENPL